MAAPRSSTRSTSAPSPTPTATASATCPASPSRLPHLRDLGVDGLWITPFYTSPQNDHGYDVADYCDVDPLFGTLDDADALIATAHDLGLKVVFDIVPNHTSSEHAWFQAALAAEPGSPERERYLFRDRQGRGRRGAAQQLGLRLRRSGLDAGRGRRPVVPPPLRHHPARPQLAQPRGRRRCSRTCCASGSTGASTASASTSRTRSTRRRCSATRSRSPGRRQARVVARRARAPWSRGAARTSRCGTSPRSTTSTALAQDPRLLRAGERMSVAEAWTQTPESTARYVRPDELHQAFNFAWLLAPWSAAAFREVVAQTLDAVEPGRQLADLGAVQPRRHPARDAVRRRAGRPGPRPRGDADDAGAARLVVPLPGRGARPARGRRRAGVPAGPVVVPHRRGRSRRLPGADPVGRRRRRRTASGPATAQPWLPQPD